MSEQPPDPTSSQVGLTALPSRVVSALAYTMVFVAGLLLALLGAFHIASRPELAGAHWPVAVLLAGFGNLALGLLAGWGLEGRAGAAAAFLGWVVGVGLVMFGGSDDVVVGGTPGDWVPLGFLFVGAAAAVVAVVVSLRFSGTTRALPGAPAAGPSSSLPASGRR